MLAEIDIKTQMSHIYNKYLCRKIIESEFIRRISNSAVVNYFGTSGVYCCEEYRKLSAPAATRVQRHFGDREILISSFAVAK